MAFIRLVMAIIVPRFCSLVGGFRIFRKRNEKIANELTRVTRITLKHDRLGGAINESKSESPLVSVQLLLSSSTFLSLTFNKNLE